LSADPPAPEIEPTLAAAMAEADFGDAGAVAIVPKVERTGVPVAPPAPADARIAMVTPLAARPPPGGGRVIAAAGWAASLLVIVVLLGAGYQWRAQVQSAWPPSQRAYAALGLH
jgi:hypothetical protein